MKKYILPLCAVLALAFISCESPSPFPGYEDAGNGSWMLALKKSGDKDNTAEVGGAMFVHMQFKTVKDSVIFDLNADPQYPGMTYPIPMRKVRFKGDFMDLMMKFHKGDSASFFIRLDSLKKYYVDTVMNPQTGQPQIRGEFDMNNPKYDTMKYIGFSLKVDSIVSKKKWDEFVGEQNKRMQVMQAVQDTLGPMQQKARMLEPELRKKDASLLKKYLADNHVTVKPDKDGIYFMENSTGDNKELKTGMIVGVRYTGMYLDGTIFDSNRLVDGQELLTFRLGLDPMMQGFTNCVSKMKKGGKAVFILPAAMGYRDSLTRVFDVEVVTAELPSAKK